MSLRNRIERLEGRRQPDQEPQIIHIVGVAPDGHETRLGAMILGSSGSAARCFDGEGYELIRLGGPRLDPPHRLNFKGLDLSGVDGQEVLLLADPVFVSVPQPGHGLPMAAGLCPVRRAS